jgi:hypothetical protein
LRHLALRRAVLAERRASATLGYAKFSANMLDAGTPDAQGSVISPGSLLQNQLIQGQIRHRFAKRSVLVSKSFSRFTWSDFRPPYSLRER